MCVWKDKAFSVMGLAASSVTLAVARSLHASSSGVGTHVQLGLPPCRFLELMRIPCPSCGLTTSFAFAAHLQFRQALVASPFGLLLFFAVVLAIPAICVQLWRQIAWARIVRAIDWSAITSWAIAAYLASWICKLTLASVLGPSIGN